MLAFLVVCKMGKGGCNMSPHFKKDSSERIVIIGKPVISLMSGSMQLSPQLRFYLHHLLLLDLKFTFSEIFPLIDMLFDFVVWLHAEINSYPS